MTERHAAERPVVEHLDVHPPPIARPAVSLLHRDPPLTPTRFFANRKRVFAVTLGSAIGLALAAAIDGGSLLLTVDEPVARWIADHRTQRWTDLFNVGSHLGDNLVVFVIGAVLAIWTVRHCRYLALALLAAAAFRPAIEFVLKAAVGRVRPDIEPLGEFHGPSHPSGHPLAAAAMWGLVPAVAALHVRSRVIWWATVAASSTVIVVVAASRVYKGAHYLTDVVASLAWAGLYLACVQGLFDRFHHDRDCRKPQHEVQAGG